MDRTEQNGLATDESSSAASFVGELIWDIRRLNVCIPTPSVKGCGLVEAYLLGPYLGNPSRHTSRSPRDLR